MTALLFGLSIGLLAASLAASRHGIPAWERRAMPLLLPSLEVLGREEEAETWFNRCLYSALAGLVTGALSGSILLGVMLAGGGALGTVAYLRVERHRRIDALERQLPATLESLASALRAGKSFPQAVGWVAQEGPQPTAGEYARLSRELALGRTVDDVFARFAGRMPGRGLRTLAMTLGPLRRMGANLIPAFEGLAEMLRRRAETEEKLKTLTAQARMQLWVMGLILPALVGVLYLMAPEFMGPLFTTTGGRVVLGFAVFLQMLGLLMARRILNPEAMWKPTRNKRP